MNLLPTQRASQIPLQGGALTRWLIEELWSDQAVGILGGEPKCCKSILALDLAVSVASGRPALRHFPVSRPGPVLLFPAEDSLAVVRKRLQAICSVASVPFDSLAVDLITQPVLRLDSPEDRQRLANTVQALHPRLLILDPLIRLHQCDENDAGQVAALLSFLRQLQRQFELAVLLVHHSRKDAHSSRPGQALRGSSELHGWGDSNLYMRRRGQSLLFSTEHRAARSQDQIPLQLNKIDEDSVFLSLLSTDPDCPTEPAPDSPTQRLRQVLAQLDQPASVHHLRKLCGMRTATVSSCLSQMSEEGLLTRTPKGYQLNRPFPVSLPIDPQGKGNGKH
jgi:AAA domain